MHFLQCHAYGDDDRPEPLPSVLQVNNTWLYNTIVSKTVTFF